ncbi:SGNH/GDSL hydrolase family protein [Clostridium fungisolvens]|uniref:Acetylxylan esterase n=1 Tax=Clostridium fungisolvens TaxID=1604897 RepID=A0A6V8SLE0_9CLOT|nr:SGNH/GDSL hydrolase family protein [Clostridium fungisolvens]GFP75693.1 Acetylxylan esterase [Clostridium fungisolvens]
MNFKNNCKVLFQGDSITDGNRTRDNDPNHFLGHGYAYIIAAKLGADEPEKNYEFFNRGVSGNRIIDLYGRWQEDTLNLNPDILSILVGVNDIVWELNIKAGISAEKYEKIYKLLIDETREKNPEVVIVICEPFILPVKGVKDNWNYWCEEIKKRQIAAMSIAKEYNCIFVPLQDEFNNACKRNEPEYWIWDGVHPTAAGHELIARKWIETINKSLK